VYCCYQKIYNCKFTFRRFSFFNGTSLFLQHCQFVQGNVPKDWPGYDYDPSTGLSTSNSNRREGGLHIAVSIVIGLVGFGFLAVVGFFVARKIRNSGGGVAQNATRDPSEGLKLEADGSVLREVMQSFERTPNSTVNGGSVEVGVNGYSDRPSRSRRNGKANGNGNIL
jgi:hypothetical protein